MAFSVARYIRDANVQHRTIRYEWDDWNEEQAEEPLDEPLLARLKNLSWRAVVAFTCATAEWIVHRYEPLSDDPLPLQNLEAAWANIVDFYYCGAVWEDYVDESDWTGPVRRPLYIAMLRVDYALQAIISDGDPEIRGTWISSLANYVLADPKPYVSWRRRILERLEALYPMDPADKLGDVVPREALDPDYDFRLDQTEPLVSRFLSGLHPAANPFLNSPEKMLELGFEGTPYAFEIEKERQARRRAKGKE
jgi:hypothetical protein